MKDLKCGLKGCKYNRGYCCCSSKICVSSSTDCTTYSPDVQKQLSSFEVGNDFIRADYSVDTAVSCDADCLFNKSGTCYANGITVSNDEGRPASCLTFVKR